MVGKYLSLVKFSHTVFALPFACVGFVLALRSGGGSPDPWLWLPVLLCMIFARSAAMAFNRYIDRHFDARNPRTAVREIPAGIISARQALLFTCCNAILFVASTWFINPLCFYLSPVALAVVLGYSYTKRFTWLCHFVLGAGLGLAPIGAFLAVTGYFDPVVLLMGLSVLCWVAGFDIIYALQDAGFDREQGLRSVPARFGARMALRISEFVHAGSALFMALALLQMQSGLAEPGWLSWVAFAVFCGLLIYQHLLVRPNDLSRVNLAFFTTNGVASVVFGAMLVTDLLT